MSWEDNLKTIRTRQISRRRLLGDAARLVVGGTLAGGLPGTAVADPISSLNPSRKVVPRAHASRPDPQGRIVWLSAEAFTGEWDPTGHMILANLHSEWNAFDRLFELDPLTGEFVPALGLYYRIIPAGLECVLRPNVKFHNGAPFTAADVKYTLERYSSPDVVTGAYFPAPVDVEVLDEHACRILTRTPLPILNFLTIINILSHGDSPHALAERYNGTGPFKFVGYRDAVLTYEANTAYWKGAPRAREFVMQYVADPNQRLAALQQGAADIIDRVPSDHVRIIEEDRRLRLVTSQSTELTYLSWKVSRNACTRSKLVRQAVAHCIDSRAIVDGVLGGRAAVPDSIFPNTVWPFGARGGSAMPGYNLDAARQKLAEAGYPNGDGLPELKAIGVAGFYPNMKEYMERIIAQCARVGIRIRLEIKDVASWGTDIYSTDVDFDIFFAGWMNMSPEPDEFLLPYYRSGSLLTSMDDSRVDDLLAAESAFTDLEGRARFVREGVVPYLADLCVNAPIVHTLNMNGTRAAIKNYAILPNSCFVLWDTYSEPG